jgi:hypothetical protein
METEAGRAAFVQAAAARALIRAFGMVAANMERERHGHSLAYGEEAFERLVVEEGLGHNQVVLALRGDG